MSAAEPANGHFVVPPHVVFRTFVAETVILNLHTGLYHGLNPSAGRMLELLKEHGAVAETARRFADEVERPVAEIQADLEAFCDDLLERGLIEVGGGD